MYVRVDHSPTKQLHWHCALPAAQPGPNSQTISRQSWDNFRTYDNLMTTGEFTEHLWQS